MLTIFVALVLLTGQPAEAARAGERATDSPMMPHREEVRGAMGKLAFLHGRWEGTVTFPGGAGGGKKILQREWIRPAAGGTALLIEGTGREIVEEGEGEVVFEALAVVGYDAEQDAYTMRTFTMDGRWVDPWIEVGEEEVRWGFTSGSHGGMKYHIWLDEQGRWRETGEFSRDGNAWVKIIDMTLERRGEAHPES